MGLLHVKEGDSGDHPQVTGQGERRVLHSPSNRKKHSTDPEKKRERPLGPRKGSGPDFLTVSIRKNGHVVSVWANQTLGSLIGGCSHLREGQEQWRALLLKDTPSQCISLPVLFCSLWSVKSLLHFSQQKKTKEATHNEPHPGT